MNRYVEDRNVYVASERLSKSTAGELRQVGKGVTHYRTEWRDEIVGEGLRHELVAAGVPATVVVTYYPESGELDVALPGDDKGKQKAKIAKVLDRHKGTEAPAHKALIEFTGSVREAAQRMAEGGEVSDAERDIVIGILAGRLA